MTIYFIEMEGSGAIKIGFTAADDAARRMAQLQTGQPAKLSLVGTIAGGQDAERAMHAEFAAYRCSGEWFEGPPLFRQFLGFMAERQMPWSYCRAYALLNEFSSDVVNDLARARAELAAKPSSKKASGWTEEAMQQQINRSHRKCKEHRERAEALSQENAALMIELSVLRSQRRTEGEIELVSSPLLETPIALACH